MWRNTRMVVFVALSAATYVAVLLPFKFLTIIPGLTEFRPGAAIPVFLSFIFGPAAAWGAGIGNLIADLIGGMFGPGSFFGFFGNLLYALVPYKLWRALAGDRTPSAADRTSWIVMVISIITAAIVCGVFIGWGVDLLGLFAFAALGNIIVINNLVASLAFAIALVFLMFARVRKMGLFYGDVLDPSQLSVGRLGRLGAVLLFVGAVGGLVVGNAISVGALDAGFMEAGFASAAKGTAAVGLGMTPFVVLIVVGCALM